jgi:CTP synthase
MKAGSLAHKIYGETAIDERHRHRYEVNLNYADDLAKHGVIFSGLSPDGKLPEIVEIKGHPFFIAVQFHPEFKSRPFAAHPIFAGFVKAAKEQAKLKAPASKAAGAA